jgi:hypothetical protein
MLIKPVAMSEDDLAAYNKERDIPEKEVDGYVTEDDPMDINTIFDGYTDLNVSHAGGEFQDIMEVELRLQKR